MAGAACEDDTSSVSESSVASVSTTIGKVAGSSHDHQSDWIHRSNILHGIALQGLVAGRAHTIPFSPRSAALPLGPISVEQVPVTDVAITSTASASEAALVRLGFAPSAAAHAVRSVSLLSDDVSPSGDVPAIYVTCRKVYTRVLVRTELEDLSPSPQLVAEVENALALPEQADQTDALRTVLRRWGSVIATRVELGCALVCTSLHESSSHIPQFGIVSDPSNPRALLAAERYVQNALRVHTDPKSPESKNGDDAFYEELYRQLSFKAVGGSHKMHLHKEPDYNSISDPVLWTVIGVDGIHSVVELLKAPHSDLYKRCLDLISVIEATMAAARASNVKAGTPPCFALPGRLTFLKHGNTAHRHISGYLKQSLPDFDPASDFAVCGWVKSGVPGSTAVAISIGCAELKYSLMGIGEWNHDGSLQVFRAWAEGNDKREELLWLRDKANARVLVGIWQHVAFVQTRDNLAYFLNGRLVTSQAAARVSHRAVTNITLCLGHNRCNQVCVDQWEGEIEGVKVWTRALTKDEVGAEADASRRPR